MRKMLGLFFLGIGLTLVGLLTSVRGQDSQLYFFPQIVVRGEPFVAYTNGGAKPGVLIFNRGESSPWRKFELKPVGSCGYLRSYFSRASPAVNDSSARCYIMPMKAVGGNPEVTSASFTGVISIVGQSLQSGSGVVPMVNNRFSKPQKPFPEPKEIPTEVPRYADYDVLTWIDSRQINSDDVTRIMLSTGMVKETSDHSKKGFKPILGDKPNLAATCNGVIKHFSYTVPFGLANAVVAQTLSSATGRNITDTRLVLKSDPVPNYTQPQTFGLTGDPVYDIPKSVKRPNLPSSGNTFNLAIVDSGVSEFSGRLMPGLNTLIAPDAPASPTDVTDDYDKSAPYYSSSSTAPTNVHMKYHGSIVAEIAAGRNGIAPFARVFPVKACNNLGSCPLESVITGVCFATNAVGSKGVVNLSLGGDSESEILTAIINDASASDIIFTASAGNKELWYRDAFLGVPMQFPAATQKRLSNQRFANNTHLLDQMIGVGALGHYQANGWKPAEFSQRGGFVDISAPGVKLKFPITKDDYHGTSFAAPFVAGAVLLARAKGVSPFNVLSSGCRPLPPAFSPFVGCGVLDLRSW